MKIVQSIPGIMMLLAITALICGLVKPSDGQANEAFRDAYRKQLQKQWAWTKQSWTGDDLPYHQIMANADKAFLIKDDPEKLLATYKREAKAKPTDPITQFRSAYLIYRMAPLLENKDRKIDEISFAVNGLSNATSPHSYLFDRLRYLLEHQYIVEDYHMQNLGKRLLLREPENQRISLDIIQDLNVPGWNLDRPKEQVIADRNRALILAKQFANRFPTNSHGNYVLGSVYEEMYLGSSNSSARDNALSSYKQYLLSLAPQSRDYRFVSDRIKKLQDGLVMLNGQYVYRDMMPR